MFNPLLPDLSKIKDQDLDNKIFELTKKYYVALRLGNGGVAQQIVLNLDAFKSEQQQRRINATKDVSRKNQEDGLDDLINVN